MTCFYPRPAWFKADGSITFTSLKAKWIDKPFYLACRQCFGCRRKAACDWATRCVHEQSLHDESCFLTLTYDNQHVPADGSLNHRDFQLFMKSFRKMFPNKKIRMLMCGEYGEDLGRPHFHALIFGHDFSDRTVFKAAPGGHSIYNSRQLDECWKRGWATVSNVTFQSAAYVGGYVFKKVNGKMANAHYEHFDPSTGEIFLRKPEYNLASKRPPLGIQWLEKYYEEIFVNDDHIVLTGDRHVGIPRAYRDWLRDQYPSLYEHFKARTVSSMRSSVVKELRDFSDGDCDVFAKEYSSLVRCFETEYMLSRRTAKAAVQTQKYERKVSL